MIPWGPVAACRSVRRQSQDPAREPSAWQTFPAAARLASQLGRGAMRQSIDTPGLPDTGSRAAPRVASDRRNLLA